MRALFLAFTFFLVGSFASAEDNPLEVSFFGSFLHSKRVPNALFFFSDIEKNDSFELRRALRTHEIDTVVLGSGGGSVWEALTMAGIIHDKGLTTYVPELIDDQGCYSACSFMFFAGTTRKVDGILAIHQMAYGKSVSNQKEAIGQITDDTQYTVSEIIGFLNEFATPPWVYEKMFRSTDFYKLTQDEKQEVNLGNIEEFDIVRVQEFLVDFFAEIERVKKADAHKEEKFSGIDPKDTKSVKVLQEKLKAAGCSVGAVDGVWGRRSEAAAKRFAAANQLDYAGLTTVSEDFLLKLVSNDKKSCPPIARPKTLAGAWSFVWNCAGGNSFRGSAILTKNGKLYNVTFSNEMGGKYAGSINRTGRQFSFYASQLNGNDVSEGSGQIASSWNVVSGMTKASCSFYGKRR